MQYTSKSTYTDVKSSCKYVPMDGWVNAVRDSLK